MGRVQTYHIDNSNFSNPYTGLAAMVLAQANDDYKRLDGREQCRLDGTLTTKQEIINFFRSPFAAVLAAGVGVEEVTFKQYVEALN